MLGIRHYCGVAIDLFQGDAELFACDALLRGDNDLPGRIAAACGLGKRHLAIVVAADADADTCLTSLKSYVATGTGALARRLTIVLPTLATYYKFQATLFSLFPEVDEVP